jgi:dTDP-glucose 4,6-dehydratase
VRSHRADGAVNGHVLVTGGAGFIGSHVCTLLLERGDAVVCLDNLTYAGSEANVDELRRHAGFKFVRGDIADASAVEEVLGGARAVINLAAETHVDRSILTPARFALTDAYGVAVLLETARAKGVAPLVQVSTDEVYGEVPEGEVDETAPVRPRSPYAASKAGGDLIAQAFAHTYGMDVRVTRGCNAYGPRQHPEKFLALMITNCLDNRRLPIYGDGGQVREWLWVEDHATAIVAVLDRGEPGGVYNIGSGERPRNIDLAHQVLTLCQRDESLLERVVDRPGHDRRYAVHAGRLRALGWRPSKTLAEGLRDTVAWYQRNEPWWRALREASAEYFERMYTRRRETLAPLGDSSKQQRKPSSVQPRIEKENPPGTPRRFGL